MAPELLWIVKDQQSDQLSQSTRSESRMIRKHVQTNRSSRHTGRFSHRSIVPNMQVVESHLPRGGRYSPRTELPMTFLSLYPSRQNLAESEAYSLDFFVHRTAREWSGWQDEYFWNTLVIQACFLNPGITHALISIAAWHRLCSLHSGSNQGIELAEFRATQCMKALGSSHRIPFCNYSSALILCVVLVYVQAREGEFQDHRLLRSAKAMLEELDTSRGMSDMRVSASERALIYGTIRPLIERLEARRCTMVDVPAALLHSVQKHRLQCLPRRELTAVPKVFTSLRHARDCLDFILHWGKDHMPVSHDSILDSMLYQHCLRNQIQCWQTALYTSDTTERLSRQGANLLRLAAIHGMVLLLTCTVENEKAFDSYVPEFREMVDILAALESYDDHRGRVSFGIDSGLINIVSFIVTRCREPGLRLFAEHWLRTSLRVEGDRSSLVCAYIARAWIDMEHKDDDLYACDDIPESRRYKLHCGTRYHAQHLIRLDFVAAPYDVAAGAPITEVWISEVTGCRLSAVSPCQLGPADVVIGSCSATIFDNEYDDTYYNVPVTNFFFPIPRI